MEKLIEDTKSRVYREDIARNGSVDITVRGNSMYPFVKNNDIVTVCKSGYERIRIGDVVLTCDEQKMLCHRVFKKTDIFLQTKADALTSPDFPVLPDAVIGKVTRIRRGKKTFDLRNKIAELAGFCISRLMVAGAYLYIPARLLRRLLLPAKCKRNI